MCSDYRINACNLNGRGTSGCICSAFPGISENVSDISGEFPGFQAPKQTMILRTPYFKKPNRRFRMQPNRVFAKSRLCVLCAAPPASERIGALLFGRGQITTRLCVLAPAPDHIGARIAY